VINRWKQIGLRLTRHLIFMLKPTKLKWQKTWIYLLFQWDIDDMCQYKFNWNQCLFASNMIWKFCILLFFGCMFLSHNFHIYWSTLCKMSLVLNAFVIKISNLRIRSKLRTTLTLVVLMKIYVKGVSGN